MQSFIRSVGKIRGQGLRWNQTANCYAATDFAGPATSSSYFLPGFIQQTYASSVGTCKPEFGIAFDVDGVLMKGSTVVPGAASALRKLTEAGIPFVVMTNGGGTTEAARAEKLSNRLAVDIQPEQVILSHTPVQELVQRHGAEPVLVVGKRYPQLREVLAAYGFHHVTCIEELHAKHPLLYPDMPPVKPEADWQEGSHKQIAAVFVMTDPILWGRDMQLCMDVLRSHSGAALGHGAAAGQSVALYSCAADLEYSTELAVPRLGAGAFLLALRSLFHACVGVDLEVQHYGKPHDVQYAFAEKLLQSRVAAQGHSHALSKYYMVGDNPLTDIRGANARGDAWGSVLVRTGMFQGGDNDPTDPASAVTDDVEAAVDWIIAQHQ